MDSSFYIFASNSPICFLSCSSDDIIYPLVSSISCLKARSSSADTTVSGTTYFSKVSFISYRIVSISCRRLISEKVVCSSLTTYSCYSFSSCTCAIKMCSSRPCGLFQTGEEERCLEFCNFSLTSAIRELRNSFSSWRVVS